MCAFRGGSLTDSDLCRLLARECSWKERLDFAVDLPAPYLEEKLSDWRCLRVNMMQRLCRGLVKLRCPDDARAEEQSSAGDADGFSQGDTGTIPQL